VPKKTIFFAIILTVFFVLCSILETAAICEQPGTTRKFELWDVTCTVLSLLQEAKTTNGPKQLTKRLKQELDDAEKKEGPIAEAIALFRALVQERPALGAKPIQYFYNNCIKMRPKEKDNCWELAHVVAQFAYKQRGEKLKAILQTIIKGTHK